MAQPPARKRFSYSAPRSRIFDYNARQLPRKILATPLREVPDQLDAKENDHTLKPPLVINLARSYGENGRDFRQPWDESRVRKNEVI
jgi:hypothetical protein